ncbi:hypothetical protein CRG98_006533 [Punica granatum]|uniref:Uncharacterized protein n=1 Tax=Punica granatum TaxID=22663 RepID=A0A2I0KX60_PUNGR|nr:hypothetical protein CRG98_006533 [Punica granatum]
MRLLQYWVDYRLSHGTRYCHRSLATINDHWTRPAVTGNWARSPVTRHGHEHGTGHGSGNGHRAREWARALATRHYHPTLVTFTGHDHWSRSRGMITGLGHGALSLVRITDHVHGALSPGTMTGHWGRGTITAHDHGVRSLVSVTGHDHWARSRCTITGHGHGARSLARSPDAIIGQGHGARSSGTITGLGHQAQSPGTVTVHDHRSRSPGGSRSPDKIIGHGTGHNHWSGSLITVMGYDHWARSPGAITGHGHEARSPGTITGFGRGARSLVRIINHSHGARSPGSLITVMGHDHPVRSPGTSGGTRHGDRPMALVTVTSYGRGAQSLAAVMGHDHRALGTVLGEVLVTVTRHDHWPRSRGTIIGHGHGARVAASPPCVPPPPPRCKSPCSTLSCPYLVVCALPLSDNLISDTCLRSGRFGSGGRTLACARVRTHGKCCKRDRCSNRPVAMDFARFPQIVRRTWCSNCTVALRSVCLFLEAIAGLMLEMTRSDCVSCLSCDRGLPGLGGVHLSTTPCLSEQRLRSMRPSHGRPVGSHASYRVFGMRCPAMISLHQLPPGQWVDNAVVPLVHVLPRRSTSATRRWATGTSSISRMRNVPISMFFSVVCDDGRGNSILCDDVALEEGATAFALTDASMTASIHLVNKWVSKPKGGKWVSKLQSDKWVSKLKVINGYLNPKAVNGYLNLCGPKFDFIGEPACARCSAAWECLPSQGRVTDTREKESPVACLRSKSRGPRTAMACSLEDGSAWLGWLVDPTWLGRKSGEARVSIGRAFVLRGSLE